MRGAARPTNLPIALYLLEAKGKATSIKETIKKKHAQTKLKILAQALTYSYFEAIGCQLVCVCLFPNSFQIADAIKLKF